MQYKKDDKFKWSMEHMETQSNFTWEAHDGTKLTEMIIINNLLMNYLFIKPLYFTHSIYLNIDYVLMIPKAYVVEFIIEVV